MKPGMLHSQALPNMGTTVPRVARRVPGLSHPELYGARRVDRPGLLARVG